MTTPVMDDAQIAEAAYFLWLAEGQPEGRADLHWQQAVDALNAPAKARAIRKPATRKAPAKTAATKAAAESAPTVKKTTRARRSPAKAPAKAKA